jgi:hypothetical protein
LKFEKVLNPKPKKEGILMALPGNWRTNQQLRISATGGSSAREQENTPQNIIGYRVKKEQVSTRRGFCNASKRINEEK